jgi:hypothetical protein
MKTFVTLAVLVVVGLGVWALWPKNTDLTIEATPSASSLAIASATALPIVTETPTPMGTVTPTPTSTPFGQGGQGPAPTRRPVFANMVSVNSSGQYGVAALTANSNDLAVVSFNMIGGPIGVYQHASIVTGTCANIGGPVYTLEPLFNGSSTTTIDANFLDIAQSKSKLAVVVYSPEGFFQMPYACGQLR